MPLVTKFLFDLRVCSLNSANVMESMTLDFPDPLWPTNTVIPGVNSRRVFLWDKKLLKINFFINSKSHHPYLDNFFYYPHNTSKGDQQFSCSCLYQCSCYQ